NIATPREVQHLAGHPGSRGGVAMRDCNPQRFEVLVGNDERERPGIINVVTDIGVEDYFHGYCLSVKLTQAQQHSKNRRAKKGHWLGRQDRRTISKTAYR